MGILDEAIREHLDLRRKRGADDQELKQLEDEAFGPPARPGEPDFPAQDEPGGGADAAAGEQQTRVVSPPDPAEPAADEPQEPAVETAPAVEAAPAPEPAAAGVAEAEDLPEPAPEPLASSTPEAEAAREAGSTFFDQEVAELELNDLDLDLEDEPPREPAPEPEEAPAPPAAPPTEVAPAPEPPVEPEPAAPPADSEADTAEPPIESLETVEHDIEQHMPPPPPPLEAPAEGPVDPVEEGPALDEPEIEGKPAAGDEEEGDGDVLEETPEFLQDSPEDDELWFEQGKPKDFDF